MTKATRARIVLLAIAAAIVAVALVPLLVVGDLPDPIATQWSFDGEVSSTMPATALLALVAVFVVPSAVAMVVVAFSRREARPGGRLWVGVVALMAAMLALVSLLTVVANQGHDSAAAVAGPPAWEIFLVIALPLAIAAAVAWAVAQLPESPLPAVHSRPLTVTDTAVADTAVVAWSRNLTVRWLLWLAAVMGAIGVGLALLVSEPWLGVVLVVSILPAALLARIEVFADRRGLTVAYGPWAWPRTHIPLDRIAAVEAIDLKPVEWGGWGYRGSLKLLRQAAVVLRAGPGLRVDLVDGRRFAVSIDDPETAAAVLDRELARS